MKSVASGGGSHDDCMSLPSLSCRRKRSHEDNGDQSVSLKRLSSSGVGRLVGFTNLCDIYKRSSTPTLRVEIQPEKYIRARYISEGCRGAMRGDVDNSYPTVKIDGYSGPAVVDVYLATTTGEPHDNILVCGSNLSSCREEVMLPGFIHAIRMRTSPDTNMKAVFDNLSIRRLRKFEVDETLKKRNIDVNTHRCDRTKACLKYVTTIQDRNGSDVQLSALSAPLQCMTEPGAPEILFVSPKSGSPTGDYQISLVGKKFKSGFKVRFFAEHGNETWQVWADVNRDLSNQGAAVVKVPRFADPNILQPVTVNIEVKIGPEREPFISDPAQFTFVPAEEAKHVLCHKCRKIVSSPARPVSSSPLLSEVPSPTSHSSTRFDSENCLSPIDSLLSESVCGSPFISAATSPPWTDADNCRSPMGSLDSSSLDSACASAAASPADTGVFSDGDPSIEDLFPFISAELQTAEAAQRPFFDFSDLPGFSNGSLTRFSTDFLGSDEFANDKEAWKKITRVVSDLRTTATPATMKILEFLDVLTRNKDQSLLKIYRRCHATAKAIPGAQPSSLMQDELVAYLMEAVGR